MNVEKGHKFPNQLYEEHRRPANRIPVETRETLKPEPTSDAAVVDNFPPGNETIISVAKHEEKAVQPFATGRKKDIQRCPLFDR